jgi:hypothetical protein
MKGIMFNTNYGLEQAVLNGTKTRTWRADKEPRYKIGDIVAIKQCYCDVLNYHKKKNNVTLEQRIIAYYSGEKGWRNKMFTRNEEMPHKIKITGIKQCRLQDITGVECLREGIFWRNSKYSCLSGYSFGYSGCFSTPLLAFRSLINKLNGKDYWESNPLGYAYEFELVK